jgi:transposase
VCRRRTKKHGEQSLGHSRGGFSTKVHLATDALGNALGFRLTGGERNDITQAEALVEGFAAEQVIADKGHDSEAFALQLKEQDTEAVIPSRATNKVQREIDAHSTRSGT